MDDEAQIKKQFMVRFFLMNFSRQSLLKERVGGETNGGHWQVGVSTPEMANGDVLLKDLS